MKNNASTITTDECANCDTPALEALKSRVEELEAALADAQCQLVDEKERNKSLESNIKATAEKNDALQRIIHHNPTVTFSWRAREDWPVVFVAGNVRRFGYAPEDFYSGRLKFVDLIHPEDRQRVTQVMLNYCKSQTVNNFIDTYRIITADGRDAWVDHHSWIMRAPDGGITHLEGALLDITDRKTAEIALMESESKFRNLTEMSLVGVYIIQAGQFKYVNPKFAHMFGYQPDEIIGKIDPDALILPKDLQRVTQNIQKRLNGEMESLH
jgi:PAS domain S-box-containing protein